jgi:Ca2+-transporting ATPase
LCQSELCDGVRRKLTEERRGAILRGNERMAQDGLRVLGFADGAIQPGPWTNGGNGISLPPDGLTWLGLAGMEDPIRPGADALLQSLRRAGIRTVMITGDQVATARSLANRLGLAGSDAELIDAAGLDALDDAVLARRVSRAEVFARVTPGQKLRIVRALQASGARVAMVGDGINDSPALRAADVGIAIGGLANSEAAREAADIVLSTGDLAALAVAVQRGRATYVNVRKGIHYLLSTNLSEVMVVLAAAAAGVAAPLTVMQLLWINLISDILPGIGLAFEPPDPDLMERPPFTEAELLGHGEGLRLLSDGASLAAGSFASLAWAAARHGLGPQSRTMTFGTLVTAQLLHTLTCRSDHRTGAAGERAPVRNKPLIALLLGSAALQGVGLLAPGLRSVLGVVPLAPVDLAATVGFGVLPYLFNQARKPAAAGQPELPEGDPRPRLV